MMLTEEDAKTKWCPFAREADSRDEDGVAANRTISGKPMTMCIGSSCMAWRWRDILKEDGSVTLVDEVYGSGGWSGRPDQKPEHRRGYCGLAGASQP